MRGFLIGMVLGFVLIGAAAFVPGLLRSQEAVDAGKAREAAELARRQLSLWNPVVETLADRANLDELKQQDAAQLLSSEQAQASVEQLNSRFSEQVGNARAADRKAGLTTNVREVDASSVAGAIAEFEKFVADNNQMWNSASTNANTAMGLGRTVYGVPDIAGITELGKARQLYGQAMQIRTRMRSLQTAALTAADRLAAAKAALTRFQAVNPQDAIDGLKSDQATMGSEQSDVQSEAERLRSTISQRESEIESILSQIASARTEMLNLQNQGFQAGNDGSFSSYKSQMEGISNRMRDLQEREHMLRWGGFEQGELDWEAVLTQNAEAAIEFDGPIVGLEELQRRLALLEDKLRRYETGIKSLGDQASMAEAIGDSARRRVGAFQEAVRTEESKLQAATTALGEQAEAAVALEDTALEHASSALAAFGNARTAADGLQRTARQTQNDFDPQRLNERLKKQLSDERPSEMAATAEAEAQTLIGRIYAERVRGIEGYQATLATIEQLGGSVEADRDALNELLTAAREEGSNNLSSAIEAYSGMAEAGGTSAWIFHAAKGSAEYLRGIINPSEADTYRANARDSLQAAVDQAGQSPYGRTYVLLLEQLQQ